MTPRLAKSPCIECAVEVQHPQPKTGQIEREQFLWVDYDIVGLWEELHDTQHSFMLGEMAQETYANFLTEAKRRIDRLSAFAISMAMNLSGETMFYINACQRILNDGLNAKLEHD